MSHSSSYFWSQPHELTAPLSVAVYQSPSITGSLDAVVSQMESIASSARQQGAQLLVFPELFLRGYDLPARAMKRSAIPRHSQEMQRLQDVARSLQLALCFGYAERAGPEDHSGPLPIHYEGECVYNSAICLDSDGSIVGHYRKTHLWQSEEKRRFVPGPSDELQQQPLFALSGHPAHRFALLICYDLEFPEPCRVLAVRGATVVLALTALADSGSVDLVPTLLVPARALENHVWICYSNLVGRRRVDVADPDDSEGSILTFRGQSAIVGPDGVDLRRAASSGDEGVLLIADIKPRASDVLAFQATPYLMDRRPDCYDGLTAGEVGTTTVKRS